jgi:hypothetical protein
VLTETIEKTTNLSQDKVIALIASGTTNKFQLFPDYMMTGEIIGNRIDTVINPQTGFSDPFKSRATGNITCDNKLTSIRITIKPSWTLILSATVWNGLIIAGLCFSEYGTFPDLVQTLKYIFIQVVWILLPFGLIRLKVNWDRRRLEKWLDNALK